MGWRHGWLWVEGLGIGVPWVQVEGFVWSWSDLLIFVEAKMELYVSDRKLAEYLNVSVWTIRKWRHERKIPCHKFGRSVRYVVEEVLAVLRKEGDQR